MRLKEILLLTTCTLVLAGCHTTRSSPRYVFADTTQPSASLAIQSIHTGSRQKATVDRNEVDCAPDGKWKAQRSFELASFQGAKFSDPPVMVRLPEGMSHFFVNFPVGSSNECSMSFAAYLEAGHSYTLKADGHLGAFFSLDPGGCRVAVIDNDTGQAKHLIKGPHAQSQFGSVSCPNPALFAAAAEAAEHAADAAAAAAAAAAAVK